MSKSSQNTPRRSRHVFFVDENLGSVQLPAQLRAAGYNVVTHFERYGYSGGILDDVIINDCAKYKNVLLTADVDMETTWAAEITSARVALVTLSNNHDGASKWGLRLETGHQTILDHLRKHRKPCAIRFGANGKVVRVRLYGKRREAIIVVR